MTTANSVSRRQWKVAIGQRIGPWQVLLNWPDDNDQGGPVSMTITPADDATDDELIGGLSSHVLRQIDFRAARDQWRQLAADNAGIEADLEAVDGIRWRSEQLRRILDTEGVSEGYLGYLAEAYVVLVRSGEQSVAAKLAEMTGRSRDTVRQHLHRVRKAGMLTTIPGKAGGQLTAKAIMAVRQATEGLGSEDSGSELQFAERLAAHLANEDRPGAGTQPVDSSAGQGGGEGLGDNEIERLKAEVETWRRLATELAEAADERAQQESAQSAT